MSTGQPRLPPGSRQKTLDVLMKIKEPEKNQRINILISESLNSELSEAAENSGVTKSAFVRVALEREFALDKKLERDIKAQNLPQLISN